MAVDAYRSDAPGDDGIEASWHGLEAIGSSLRDAASAEAWVEVVELAVKRHRNLLAHFERFPVGPANADFYVVRLPRMLEGEQQLQALALAARKRVMREGADANRTRRAVGAYLAQ